MGGTSTKNDKKVGLLNLNVRDNRKTHKRDIEQKTKTDEVVATVLEITDVNTGETTTNAPTSEASVDTTTQPNETETTEKTIENLEATTPPSASTTTQETTVVVDPGFQPILGVYYGGAPNHNANNIYLTTSSPLEELAPEQTFQILF